MGKRRHLKPVKGSGGGGGGVKSGKTPGTKPGSMKGNPQTPTGNAPFKKGFKPGG